LYPHKTLFSGRNYLNIQALTPAYHPEHRPEPHPTTLTGDTGHEHYRPFTGS